LPRPSVGYGTLYLGVTLDSRPQHFRQPFLLSFYSFRGYLDQPLTVFFIIPVLIKNEVSATLHTWDYPGTVLTGLSFNTNHKLQPNPMF
jgi:hypothetical protein